MPQVYCVKCRTKREIKNPRDTVLKNNRQAVRGRCSVCGVKVVALKKALGVKGDYLS